MLCMCGAYVYMSDDVYMPQHAHKLKAQLEIL